MASRIVNASILLGYENRSVEGCLSACAASRTKCKAMNYDVSSRSCILFTRSRTDKGVSIAPDEAFDYYEPACPTEAHDARSVTTLTPSSLDTFQLRETNRTLRQQFRNVQHMQTENLGTCWLLCRNATTFVCRTFSYSESRRECMVSSNELDSDLSYVRFTQQSAVFDLYVRLAAAGHVYTTTVRSRSQFTFPTLVHDSALRRATTTNSIDDTAIFDTSNSVFNSEEQIRSTSTRPMYKSGITPDGVYYRDMHSKPMLAVREFLGPNTSAENWKLMAATADPELQQLAGFESIPRLTAPSEHVGFVPPETVKVRAECHDTGMNISFLLSTPDEKYTGAVYAAERFEQCRIFVRSSSRFAIFIPRPQHNTWCNALEIDKVVSAVIVMSNDRVLPHDVTTKDDLFFHVTCNYTTSTVNEIRQGIVVGGPSPIAIATSEVHRQISLQIMKEGRPVDSVFIGETLVARVASEISPTRLRIVECAAHRVGGSGAPTSVALIADGCALLPSLMAPMKLGEHGWESALSAFRIDGSEQIDVVCMVAVCQEEACPTMSCPPSKDRSARSLEEKHPIRVDHRLIVRARTTQDLERDDRAFSELCLQPPVYLSGLALLAVCLLVLAVLICIGAKRRSDSIEDLLSISQVGSEQKDFGAKYVRTLSM